MPRNAKGDVLHLGLTASRERPDSGSLRLRARHAEEDHVVHDLGVAGLDVQADDGAVLGSAAHVLGGGGLWVQRRTPI